MTTVLKGIIPNVLAYDVFHKKSVGLSRFLCLCDCGTQKVVAGGDLKKGHTVSCGCYNREQSSLLNRTHGMSHTREWEAWHHMKQRCYDLNNVGYEYYGGRGIRVCDEWLMSFGAFFAHVGPRPSDIHSIDRFPDTNGNYEPGNVRWATDGEQARNRRDNVLVSQDGATLCATDWSIKLGKPRNFVGQRIRTGIPLDEVLDVRDRRTK